MYVGLPSTDMIWELWLRAVVLRTYSIPQQLIRSHLFLSRPTTTLLVTTAVPIRDGHYVTTHWFIFLIIWISILPCTVGDWASWARFYLPLLLPTHLTALNLPTQRFMNAPDLNRNTLSRTFAHSVGTSKYSTIVIGHRHSSRPNSSQFVGAHDHQPTKSYRLCT